MASALYRFSAAIFDPQQVVVLTAAFEKAWAEIAGNFSPDAIPAARDRLAKAIIEAAPGWPHTVDALAQAGMKLLAARYSRDNQRPNKLQRRREGSSVPSATRVAPACSIY